MFFSCFGFGRSSSGTLSLLWADWLRGSFGESRLSGSYDRVLANNDGMMVCKFSSACGSVFFWQWRYWIGWRVDAVVARHVLYRFDLLILGLEVCGAMAKSFEGWATLAMTPPN